MTDENFYISYEAAQKLKDKADAYDKALQRAKLYYNNELSNGLTRVKNKREITYDTRRKQSLLNESII